MPKRFDLLVFDWDGTLMDSAGAIVASLQAACRDLGLPVPSEECARHIIGLGLNDALAHVLPHLEPAHYGTVVERYRHHFTLRDGDIPLFPGAAETVRTLHAEGFLLGVATGKSRHGLERVLVATGLKDYFHATRCADEGFSKPHPGMLLELIEMLGVDPGRTLMIGDTTHDMEMAQSARVPCLGAAYGAHPREQLLDYAPLACVGDFAELARWLMENA
ncbi:MAG: HAD-IA family hydrolase [Betaproteobacteria bacterium]|nr:HAD-IA family hydrolase [Betaproteobacteria bacterium]